jgi:hypothetical protein
MLQMLARAATVAVLLIFVPVVVRLNGRYVL